MTNTLYKTASNPAGAAMLIVTALLASSSQRFFIYTAIRRGTVDYHLDFSPLHS